MRLNNTAVRLTLGCVLLLIGSAADGQNPLGQRVDWIGEPGVEESWSDATNWGDYGFGSNVPDGTAPVPSPEYASVSLQGGAGRAVIDTAITQQPTDIILGEDGGSTGSLIVRDGGSITVSSSSGTGNGALVVGASGVGNLALEDDMGAVSVSQYSQGSSGNLFVRLSGPGTFAQHVTASSGISLDGDLGIERLAGSNFTLSTGQSWTVVSGSPVSGNFDTISVDETLLGNLGQTLAVSTSGNAVTLSVSQRLILSVDQYTGAATLRNEAGHSVDIDLVEYTLSASTATLNSSNSRWKSFADDSAKPDWLEANPSATSLSEVNGGARLTLSSGDSHDFGTPFNVNSSAPMGTARVDLSGVSFLYANPDNGVQESAAIERVGANNDMSLVVDPNSGNATIQNQFGQPVDFVSYTISSPSGSLLPGSFDGIEGGSGPDWYEANWTSTDLSEVTLGDAASLSFLDSYDLGLAWDAASGERDLTFIYQDPDTGQLIPGQVYYGEVVQSVPSVAGDYNGNGSVDLGDYTVWRDHLGGDASTLAAGTRNPANTGPIGLADYEFWKSSFGGAGSAAIVGPAAVPEPAAWMMVAAAAMLFGLHAARRS